MVPPKSLFGPPQNTCFDPSNSKSLVPQNCCSVPSEWVRVSDFGRQLSHLPSGGRTGLFLELAKYYKWKSLSLQIRIMDVKRFFENSTSLTLHRGSENLKIPIIGSKIKVVVNFIYGYQNLSGEKYKTNEKRFSSIGHTSHEKNPKNYPKTQFFRKVTVGCPGISKYSGISKNRGCQNNLCVPKLSKDFKRVLQSTTY